MGGVEKVQQPGWEAGAAVGQAQPVDTADPSAVTVLKAELEQKSVSNHTLLIYIYRLYINIYADYINFYLPV